MRKLAFTVLGIASVVLGALHGCSLDKESPSGADSGPPLPGPADVRATPPSTDSGPAEAKPRPPKPSVPSTPGVYLVNGTSSFPAFRVCKADDQGAVLSTSLAQPVPTAIMPRSSLAAVDVLAAVRIEPSSEIGADADVIVLAIDDTSKSNPRLPSGSCIALACPQAGGGCLGAERLRRVAIFDRGTNVAHPGAFSEPGAIVVLRDDAGDLRFEVERANAVPPGLEGDLDVDFHNLSNDLQGSASYSNRGGAPDGLSPSQLATSFQLPSDYTLAKVAFGKHEESLADIHDFSEPRVPIDTYFRAPGAFLLLLVGSPDQDAAPDRKQRFVALPVNGLPDPVVSVDAGTD